MPGFDGRDLYSLFTSKCVVMNYATRTALDLHHDTCSHRQNIRIFSVCQIFQCAACTHATATRLWLTWEYIICRIVILSVEI